MAIEALLNKIELANRFTRAVAVGNPRDFIFALQEDQQVAKSCNRLIKNAIVCWNYLYLEMRLRTAEPAMRAEMMRAIKRTPRNPGLTSTCWGSMISRRTS